MPSPEAEAITSMMRAVRDSLDEVPTLEQQRAGAEMFGQMTADPGDLSTEEVDAGGVPALLISTGTEEGPGRVLFLHGGGYVAGSAATHRSLCGHLALHAGCPVLSVDYRLAPEHPFPAALDDAMAAWAWLLGQGVGPGDVVLAGDSAGAGLVLAALLRNRDEGGPAPAGAFLMSPYADATCSSERYRSQAEADLLVSLGSAQVSWGYYLQGTGIEPTHPLVSPAFGSYEDLPPLLVHVGSEECLLGDAELIAERARAAAVEVDLQVWPGMQHVFQIGAGNIPEAGEALGAAGGWIRRRLGAD